MFLDIYSNIKVSVKSISSFTIGREDIGNSIMVVATIFNQGGSHLEVFPGPQTGVSHQLFLDEKATKLVLFHKGKIVLLPGEGVLQDSKRNSIGHYWKW